METLARFGHSCGRPFLVDAQRRDNPDYVFDDLIDIIPGNVSAFGALDPLEVTVSDEDGGPVKGANVVLTSIVDGAYQETVTGPDGKALLPMVPHSHYRVEAEFETSSAGMSYVHDGDGTVSLVLQEGKGPGGVLSGGPGALAVIIFLMVVITVVAVLYITRMRRGDKGR
jgi:hypothetical protein